MGSAPAQTALLGGHVEGIVPKRHRRHAGHHDKTLRGIGSASKQRWRELLSTCPTIAEQGYPDFELYVVGSGCSSGRRDCADPIARKIYEDVSCGPQALNDVRDRIYSNAWIFSTDADAVHTPRWRPT